MGRALPLGLHRLLPAPRSPGAAHQRRLGPLRGAHPRAGVGEQPGGGEREEDPPLHADVGGDAVLGDPGLVEQPQTRAAARPTVPRRARPRRRRRADWNSRPSARTNSRKSTASATSSTAASTNEKTANALRLRLTSGAVLAAPTTAFCWYQGRNIETNSAIAESAARRWSRSRVPQACTSAEPAEPGWAGSGSAGSGSPAPPRMRASLGTHRLYGGSQRRLAGAPTAIVPVAVALLPARSTAWMLTS